jgi:von Willebrand factor type A domain/Aerotolerance regulator N-terminal
MSFAAPALLAALTLLAPALLAFLVHRRRDVVRVPSTRLFRVTAASTATSRRMRNIKRLIALLACLGGIAALVVAAARPTRAARGETVAFIVDVSASMDAGPGARPLAEARRHLERTLATASPEDRYAIIAASTEPRLLVGPEPPGPRVDEAIAALRAERGGADLGAATMLAGELLAGAPGARIVVLTDGGESLGDPVADRNSVPLTQRTIAIGGRDNLGVFAFASRPPRDAVSDEEREVEIDVATSSDRARVARVIVTADGEELARRRLEIPPSGEAATRVRLRSAAHELRARVEPGDGLDDALASDDEARLFEAARRPPRALLLAPAAEPAKATAAEGEPSDAGESSRAAAFFAEKALLAAGVNDVVRVPPSLDGVTIAPGDLIVALDDGPPRPVDAPTLYLGTRRGALPVTGFRELGAAAAKLRSVEGRDAILRGVVLDGVTIDRALAVDVPPAARALVDLDGGTVVAAGGAGQRAWVYLGIDPSRSDLALRVAFPVMVANALHAALGAADVATAETISRAEIALRPAPLLLAPAAEPALSGIRLPASPALLLALAAAVLLALEALMFRKGWAS